MLFRSAETWLRSPHPPPPSFPRPLHLTLHPRSAGVAALVDSVFSPYPSRSACGLGETRGDAPPLSPGLHLPPCSRWKPHAFLSFLSPQDQVGCVLPLWEQSRPSLLCQPSDACHVQNAGQEEQGRGEEGREGGEQTGDEVWSRVRAPSVVVLEPFLDGGGYAFGVFGERLQQSVLARSHPRVARSTPPSSPCGSVHHFHTSMLEAEKEQEEIMTPHAHRQCTCIIVYTCMNM